MRISTVFDPDINKVRIVKKRGLFKSQFARFATVSNASNFLKQTNMKQLKYDFKTIKLQSRDEIKGETDPWYQKDKPVSTYRLIMRQLSPNQDKNLCIYFQSKQIATSCMYYMLTEGLSNEEGKGTSLKQIFQESGKDLRQKIAEPLINHLRNKNEQRQSAIKREQQNQQRKKRQQFIQNQQKAAIQNLFYHSVSDEQYISKVIDNWVKQIKEPLSINVSTKTVSTFQNNVVFSVKSLKLSRNIRSNQLKISITFSGQTKQCSLVPVGQNKQYIYYNLSNPLFFTKSTRQIESNLNIIIKIISSQTQVLELILTTRQLYYNNLFGKSLSLPLNPKGSLKKKLNRQVQDHYAELCYPYFIDIEAYPIDEKELDLISLRKQGLKLNSHFIPNHHGIKFYLPLWSQNRVLNYRRHLNLPTEQIQQLSYQKILNVREALLKLFQQQQSRSLGSESIGDQYSILQQRSTNNYLQNCLKLAQKGIIKSKRFETYWSMLKIDRLQSSVGVYYSQIQKDMNTFNIYRENLQQDYEQWVYNNDKQQAAKAKRLLLIYLAYQNKKIQGSYFYHSSLLPLALRIINFVESSLEIKKDITSQQILKQSFWFLLAFIQKITPYYNNSSKIFIEDLEKIRLALEKYEPNYNKQFLSSLKTLNKIGDKMLKLWSDEHPQITFRIWDILVYVASTQNNNKNVIALISYTHLKYWRKYGDIEITNFNQFIANVFKSIRTLDISNNILPINNEIEQSKRYLKQISNTGLIFQTLFPIQNDFPEQPQHLNVSDKYTLQTSQLAFRQTKPNFVSLMIKRIRLYSNVGVAPFKLMLIHHTDIIKKYQIYTGLDKFVFPNYYLHLQSKGFIEIVVEYFSAQLKSPKINLSQGQINTLQYKHMKLLPKGEANYSSQNNCDIIILRQKLLKKLNSKKYTNNFKRKNSVKTNLIKNPIIQMTNHILTIFENIKRPLDQFETPETNARLSFVKNQTAQWINNSLASYDELLRIKNCYRLSEQQSQGFISLLNKSYQVYKSTEKINFGRILLFLTISLEINLKTKIYLIFNLLRKYETNKGQTITQSSLVSFFQQVALFFNIKQQLYIPQVSIINATLFYASNDVANKQITSIIQQWIYNSYKANNSLDFILGTVDNIMVLKKLLPQSDVIKIKAQKGCLISITYKTETGVYIWSSVIDGQFNIVKRGEKQGLVYPLYLSPTSSHSKAQFLHNYQNVLSLMPSEPITKQKFNEIVMKNPITKYLLSNQNSSSTRRNIHIGSIHVYVQGQKRQQVNFNNSNVILRDLVQSINKDVLEQEYFYQRIVVAQNTVISDLDIKVSHIASILRKHNHIELHFFRQPQQQLQQIPTEQNEIQNLQINSQISVNSSNLSYNNLALYRYQNSITVWKPCYISSKTQNSYSIIYQHIPEKYFSLPTHEVIKLQYDN